MTLGNAAAACALFCRNNAPVANVAFCHVHAPSCSSVAQRNEVPNATHKTRTGAGDREPDRALW